MPVVLHALWIAGWVLVAFAFFGVAFLGMVGLSRAGYRFANRRGWKEPRPTAFAMATGLVAFLGGWLFYVCWWPLARLFRPWPRLRVIGPAVGVVTLIVGGGVTLATVGGPCAFDPPPGDHSDLQVINDTGEAVVVAECDDSACRSQSRYLRIDVQANATASLQQVEACGGNELGASQRGQIRPYACLTEPTEDDQGDLAPVRVSRAHPCGE